MSDYLELIGQDLVDAARRRAVDRERRARPPLRSLLLAAALALIVAGSAMAGTLYVLRGSPIPAPDERDAGAAQTVEPGTSSVLPMRAADPAGGPAWALRVARSRTGSVCSTVGQVVAGEFGLVGLDGRFRRLADGVVDSCGLERRGASSLIGARVLDASRPADVRTVVSGVAGADLRSVTVDAAGRRSSPAIGPGGTFVVALRGFPENLGVDVRLAFAGGRTERHPLGVSRFVTPDPAGDRAWKTAAFTVDGYAGACVAVRSARNGADYSGSPPACGRLGRPNREHGYFFAVRHLSHATRRFWRAPPRTAVWGELGGDVARIEVVSPGSPLQAPQRSPSGAFLVMLPGDVAPRAIRVRVVMRDGSVRVHRGDTNLIQPPEGMR